ncbi:hypothetical protein PT276_03595 [Orbaceae bacterium ESL0721]|nr:hypothetical protein [Orbaceae bacterium ESL0721]
MKHTWTFQHVGGVDQVYFLDADDIINLPTLDPKLWVALSCPTAGINFNTETLQLLDRDKDGHIRIPDILDAISWIRDQLCSLDSFLTASDQLPISEINPETETGRKLQQTAQSILNKVPSAVKQNRDYLTQADVEQAITLNAKSLYNGDAIFPPSDQLNPDMRTFIQTAIDLVGGVLDASGETGINQQIATALVEDLQKWQKWQNEIKSIQTPFGADTAAIGKLVEKLKSKIDDYFLRVALAQYAPQAESTLNVNEKYIVPSDNQLLSHDALADLPLSKIVAGQPLNLVEGINPCWQAQIDQFRQLINPYLTNADQLTHQEWLSIEQQLIPYLKLVETKPAVEPVAVTVVAKSSIDDLPQDLINTILAGDYLNEFSKMVAKDKRSPITATDVQMLKKLVLFHKYLYQLLLNFTSFADFFDPSSSAIFQIGKLFIDGRCATLCVAVDDIAKHSTLANYSELCLLYCECTRQDQKQFITAAMTIGSGDYLMTGRNGVFIDNNGNDWDATVVKMVTKPISISQAIWAPYQRIGRLITEQLTKWASSRDASIDAESSKLLTSGDPKFDIGKSVGIFAAIGLALGALGTAVASICQALFGLKWWQFPLLIVGLFLVISGPSVILAWIKLRRRTLGPLLEASGWAINSRIKISLFSGRLLTSKAELPQNAKRNLLEPFKKRSKKPLVFSLLALLLGVVITAGYYYYFYK